MGTVSSTTVSAVVLPEILTFSGDEILLVHGIENGCEFWWPPGSYWLAEKACSLTAEQPEAWIDRVLRAQVRVSPTAIRLRSVEFIDRTHPPVLVYEARLEGAPEPSAVYAFDAARFFPVADLPGNLGRDSAHGQWLRGLLQRTHPMLTA
jgi:hypothetical protein